MEEDRCISPLRPSKKQKVEIKWNVDIEFKGWKPSNRAMKSKAKADIIQVYIIQIFVYFNVQTSVIPRSCVILTLYAAIYLHYVIYVIPQGPS